MTTTSFKVGLITLVIAGVVTALVIQHRTQTRLREENQSLRRQIAQLQSDNLSLIRHEAVARLMLRLPVPHIQTVATSNGSPSSELQFTNLYSRFTNGAPKLTAAQVEAYVKANRTNAASLLAAFRTSGDLALLKEAMIKYPNDPQVAFEAVFDERLSPEEQRQWLDAFEKSAPNNALANYLSALNYFKASQADQAVQELLAADGKGFDDYTLQRAQDNEEAYLSAGYSAAEAARLSDDWLTVPQLAPLKQLGLHLLDLANAYKETGDQVSAQAALQMEMNLGKRYGDASTSMALISQLVGLAIERMALSAMDPNSQTVQNQINQIAQTKAVIRKLAQQTDSLFPTLSDQDLLNYENRRRAFGEVAAMQWLVNKFGQP